MRRLVVALAIMITILAIFTLYLSDLPGASSATMKAMVSSLEKVKKFRSASRPHVHSDLYPSNLTLINIQNFSVRINHDICNISNIALVSVIHSAVPNFATRQIIRSTWGNPNISGVNTRLVFFVGETSDETVQARLDEEADMFHDVVQGGFHDSYQNLSYKNIFGKLWVSTFCEQAEFVVKTDDDMFVDLFATYFITRPYLSHPQYLNHSFILCPVFQDYIVRDKGSTWTVDFDEITKEEAPDNRYPPNCKGFIYIYSPGTARRLAEQATKTKFFWIDDVWVTGYLVQHLKFDLVPLQGFATLQQNTMLLVKSYQNPVIYNEDLIFGPMSRNFEVSLTLYSYSKWCYINKCLNNIYYKNYNLTEVETAIDKVMKETVPRHIY